MLKELQKRGHEVGVLCAHITNLITPEEAGFPIHKVLEPSKLGKDWGLIHDAMRQYNSWIKLNDKEREDIEKLKDEMFNEAINTLGKPDVIISHAYWAHMFFNQIKKQGVITCDIAHRGLVRNGFDFYLFNSEYSRNDKSFIDSMISTPYKTNITDNDLLLYPLCVNEPIISNTSPEFDIGQIKLDSNKGPNTFWGLVKAFPDKKFLAIKGVWGVDAVPINIPSNLTIIPASINIINDFFSKIKVYIHPALSETFGMAGLEAQYLGIPVVYRDIGGLKESIGYGGVACNNDDDFKKGIAKLFKDENINIIKELGFKHAKEMYDKTMAQYDIWLMKLTQLLQKN
jgi:glycosyltransferase involved in cell wall biosynthesis